MLCVPPLILLICLGAALAGCATDKGLSVADIRPLHYSTGPLGLKRVEGLRAALQASPTAPVRVLAVHGMITHEPDYSEPMQTRLAARLGLRAGSVSDHETLARDYEFTPAYGPQPFEGASKLPPSTLKRTRWTAPGPDGRPIDRLIVYELLWSPLRDQVKNSFVGCFERGQIGTREDCRRFSASQPNPDRRLLINRALKETITLGGFADATLVLGPIGDVIRDDLTLALCVIASEFILPGDDALTTAKSVRCNLAMAARQLKQPNEAGRILKSAKFLALTYSLGSFVFMDAQNAFVAADARIGDQARAGAQTACREDALLCDQLVEGSLLFNMTDQATVFMNANQISLLALARLSPAGCRPNNGSLCPNPYLRSRSGDNAPWNLPLGMSRMTTFVAFNDTDDLLGFEVPPFMGDTDGNRFVNVSVRNPAFTIPFLFKNPGGAHTNQADNPAVVEAIVEGFDIPR